MNNKGNVNIRRAKLGDLERLTSIYNWAVLNTVSTFDLEERTKEEALKWFEVHQNPLYPIYVIQDELHKNIGWGSISPFHSRPAYRITGEFSIYIEQNKFGNGYGSRLLSVLTSEASKLGFNSLMGLVCSENVASLKMSEKLGFKQVGYYNEVGIKFGRLLDIVVIQKIL